MHDTLKARAIALGYSGKLVTPPDFSRNDSADYTPLGQDTVERFADEMIERVELLAEHYGVAGSEPHDFLHLIVCLASDWVPGFGAVSESTPKKKRGRPTNRMRKFYDFELYTTIERIRHEKPTRTLAMACRIFLTRNRTHDRWSSVSPEALANNYRRIAKNLGAKRAKLKTFAQRTADFNSMIKGVKAAYAERYGKAPAASTHEQEGQ